MIQFFRWQMAAGAIASVVMGALAIAPLPAIALEREEVVRRLGAVPVFTVIRDNGQPLVLFPQAQETGQENPGNGLIFNFFDPDDVKSFVEQLKERNPEAMASTTILVSSLGEMYEWPERNRDRERTPQLIYTAIEESVTAAMDLLRQEGEAPEEFPGIPLFVATGSSDDDYLTLEQDGQKVVPFFFSRTDIDRMIEVYRTQQPEAAGQAQVKVTSLDRVVGILEEGQPTDEFVNRIRLIPSEESIRFIQSIQQEEGGGAAPASGNNGANGANNNRNGGNSGANGGASNLLR